MAETFDPSEWIRLDEEEIILLRRLLREEQIREQANHAAMMQCVRLDNALARLMDDAG